MKEDGENRQDPPPERQRVVLPAKRNAPRSLADPGELTGARPGPPPSRPLPEERAEERALTAVPELPDPILEKPAPLIPEGSKMRLVLCAIIPIAVLICLMVFVSKLDDSSKSQRKIDGGTIYRVSDGIIAEQDHPDGEDEEKKMYYLIEAPRESDPQITFRESGMTMRVWTDEGMRVISWPADWSKAHSGVVYFTFQDYFQKGKPLRGDLAMVKQFVTQAGEGGSIRSLINRIEALKLDGEEKPAKK